MGSGARARQRGVRGHSLRLAAAGLTARVRLGRAPATAPRCAHRRPRPAAASQQPHLAGLGDGPASGPGVWRGPLRQPNRVLLLHFWGMAAAQGTSRRWTSVRVMKGSGLGCSLHAGAPGPSAAYPDYPHCMNEHFAIRCCEGEPGVHALSHMHVFAWGPFECATARVGGLGQSSFKLSPTNGACVPVAF